MRGILRHKLIWTTIIIQIFAISLLFYLVKENQGSSTDLAQSTTLFFKPTTSSDTPLIKAPGDAFSIDLMVDPESKLISMAKVEINYDPTKVKLNSTSPIVINSRDFPVTLEGPIITENGNLGKIQAVVSVGSYQTKVIQEVTKILSLNMVAVGSTDQAQISVNNKGSKLLTISPYDTNSENVLSYSYPVYITVNTESVR